jgi:hypothetical protein
MKYNAATELLSAQDETRTASHSAQTRYENTVTSRSL